MIVDILSKLARLRLVLGSSSPRRLELLRQIGLSPEVIPSKFEENLLKSAYATPDAYVIDTSKHKAIDVCHQILGNGQTFDIILTCDSVVINGSKILEKPADKDACIHMISELSGKTHRVVSALTLIIPATHAADVTDLCDVSTVRVLDRDFLVLSRCESTNVTFEPLERSAIEAYAATTDPYDKAGGYGIQSIAAQFVSRIDGDYYTVVGLPLCQLCKILRRLVTP